MAYIGKEPTVGNFQVCDAISVVNGQAAYTMQVSSVNVSPETANHMLVSLNGVLQAPTSSYTVAGATITFASNLVTGDVINFIHILGSVLDLGVPSDATVSIAKLTATGTKNSTTFLRGDNTFAAPSGGKVLQVVGATETAQRTISSTSFINSSNGITVNITPSATSSKIFVIVSTNFFGENGQNLICTIYRDSTNLGGSSGMMINGGFDEIIPGTMTFLDSPSSTSELTYQMYAKVSGGSLSKYGEANSPSVITAFEIGA